MNAKDTVSKGYDCFSKGDMETVTSIILAFASFDLKVCVTI